MNSADRHLRFGWWSLFAWLALGVIVEALHGFKLAWYLDVGNETRRLMLTLAHAHGTLLALVNIAAGLTARLIKDFALARPASAALWWAALLLPAGFFLGAFGVHGGDPGLGILLVPVGALLLLFAVGRIARDLSKIKSA
jgi:hypothetical protein